MPGDAAAAAEREWLVGNGLGGYAAGTEAGALTRRFHGVLIAALPAGRTLLLNRLDEELPGSAAEGLRLLELALEEGLPRWRYQAPLPGGVGCLEKRLFLVRGRNTCVVLYRRVDTEPRPLALRLRPALSPRRHDGRVDQPLAELGVAERPAEPGAAAPQVGLELTAPTLPALRLLLFAEGRFARDAQPLRLAVDYPVEQASGYDHHGELGSPGAFELVLGPGQQAALVVSCEPWATLTALDPFAALAAEQARRRLLLGAAALPAPDPFAAALVLAADAFLITKRPAPASSAGPAGEPAVIAGYPWFSDWGRDTMISLEGLTLCTGRHAQAAALLRAAAAHARDGLIPNLFPEGQREGDYHTADATLWFFHAVDRYVSTTGDRATLRALLPTLSECADQHLRGTRYGIGVDPADGLLRQGLAGHALTWMDAKVEGWVVTPRRGKAVELSALWYNALCLLADWLEEDGSPGAPRTGGTAARYRAHAAQTRAAFNARFPAPGGGLFDVIDGEGDDPACRPNQILSFALRHPVLDPQRWPQVLAVVQERLLTPVGLRTLDPAHPAYQPRCAGDLRARDLAYHQGTVWPWLIGPFIDAWLRVHPDDRAGARRLLAAFPAQLQGACLGTLSEIHDGDASQGHTPRGCFAQAWSVAEVLRAWRKTAPD